MSLNKQLAINNNLMLRKVKDLRVVAIQKESTATTDLREVKGFGDATVYKFDNRDWSLALQSDYDQIDVLYFSVAANLVFAAFRTGEVTCLVVSKVANFSVDLPEATIAIQVSGAFGSRQEEAQRLGRILRPKSDGRGAKFYSVVSRDTIDQDFAQNRQRFLAEQGYSYRIIDADDVFQGKF